MPEQRCCDFCGRPESELSAQILDGSPGLELDEDGFMSAWSFVTQWLDGTTVWRAEDSDALALVAPDGSVHLRPEDSF